MATDGIVGILLAAGAATRFGSDKLLHPLADGTPLALVAARHLRATCRRCVAVLRSTQTRLHELLLAEGFEVHMNEAAAQGMGRSLALAVRQAPQAQGWLVALADMPFIPQASFAAVAASLQQGASIVAPVCRGQRGHPVGFASQWFSALAGLQGDQGARSIVSANPQALSLIATDDAGVVADVDTPEDLMRMSL